MKIIYTNEFRKSFKKLPNGIKEEAFKKEKLFRKNIKDLKLKSHKLSGKLKDCWAFSVSFDYRIIYELGENDIVYFHAIGTHDIYK